MNWVVFIAAAVIIAAAGGLLGGWLLPMAGIGSGLARIIGFAIAGGIIGLLFVKMRGTPPA